MQYHEPLPEGCPPDSAEEIISPRIVYRLVRKSPPKDKDFRSQRAENPTARFNVSECMARGLSVFANRRDAEKWTKRGNLRGWAVFQVVLAEGAGRIKKTGRDSHYTWWPYAAFISRLTADRCADENH